jgi:type II secretory pathway component PulC
MRVIKLILKKYPWAVMAPVVGGILLVGVSTAYTMYRAFSYTPPTLPKGKGAEMTSATPEPRPPLDHYSIIVQRDLFTSAVSGTEENKASDPNNLRAAAVSFKLKGTVVVSSGFSFAIVEDPASKKEEIFHENDVVQGYKIVKIMRNKVIVDKDGYEEVVEVIEEEQSSNKTPGPVQRPNTIQKAPVRRPIKVAPSPNK